MNSGDGILLQDAEISIMPCGDGEALIFSETSGWQCELSTQLSCPRTPCRETTTIHEETTIYESIGFTDAAGIIIVAAILSIIANRVLKNL